MPQMMLSTFMDNIFFIVQYASVVVLFSVSTVVSIVFFPVVKPSINAVIYLVTFIVVLAWLGVVTTIVRGIVAIVRLGVLVLVRFRICPPPVFSSSLPLLSMMSGDPEQPYITIADISTVSSFFI